MKEREREREGADRKRKGECDKRMIKEKEWGEKRKRKGGERMKWIEWEERER